MPKPELNTIPEFYHKYVKLVAEESAVEALTASTPLMLTFFHKIPEQTWDHRYAEGKWSIKELVQHMIDTERIFSYRALCFSRGEKGSLPGFDENTYAAWSDADRRNKEDLIREFSAVREATLLLFRSFTEDQLNRTGIANNNPVSVNGIGFITAGHMLHHLDILQDRYLS
jgi:uncharacterized damage-inducible protein DinB